MLGKLSYGEVVAYIVNLLISSGDEDERWALLGAILNLVEQAGVKPKLEKCGFMQNQIEYEVGTEGVRPSE